MTSALQTCKKTTFPDGWREGNLSNGKKRPHAQGRHRQRRDSRCPRPLLLLVYAIIHRLSFVLIPAALACLQAEADVAEGRKASLGRIFVFDPSLFVLATSGRGERERRFLSPFLFFRLGGLNTNQRRRLTAKSCGLTWLSVIPSRGRGGKMVL